MIRHGKSRMWEQHHTRRLGGDKDWREDYVSYWVRDSTSTLSLGFLSHLGFFVGEDSFCPDDNRLHIRYFAVVWVTVF